MVLSFGMSLELIQFQQGIPTIEMAMLFQYLERLKAIRNFTVNIFFVL